MENLSPYSTLSNFPEFEQSFLENRTFLVITDNFNGLAKSYIESARQFAASGQYYSAECYCQKACALFKRTHDTKGVTFCSFFMLFLSSRQEVYV